MKTIRIIWPGRIRNENYRAAVMDYAARIRRLASLEIVETRESGESDRGRARRVRRESAYLEEKRRGSATVVLDAGGKQLSSEEFAQWIDRQTGEIDFLLGGPAGLIPPDSSWTLSLGRMTLPHELVRVVLLEQIYRALTILKRIPYHK